MLIFSPGRKVLPLYKKIYISEGYSWTPLSQVMTWKPTWPCWSSTNSTQLTPTWRRKRNIMWYAFTNFHRSKIYFHFIKCTVKVSDKMHVVVKILLKALANLPHTDFVLCKCLLSQVGHWKSQTQSLVKLNSFRAGGAGWATGEDPALPSRPAGDVPVQGLLAADPCSGMNETRQQRWWIV